MCSIGLQLRGHPRDALVQMLDEEVELYHYNKWQVFLPEGTFMTQVRRPWLMQARCTIS